ncbi:MAG: response regulator transcription factor [Acidobacteria bacterium]|nr:response regulator transcription factor [Acidobacteriota bacterium]
MSEPVLPPETPEPEREPQPLGGGRTSIALFALIAVLMATDLTIEYRIKNEPLSLQGFELIIFVLALAGFAFHWRQMVTARRRSQQLDRELAEARAEVTRWSADAKRWNQEAQAVLQGLGQAIDRQFDRWGLTPAEREVALLQLKGLRHRAIAELRQTSERTVRQQALAVYRKSGLNGRSDLAAFFLEDLLLPASTSSDVRESVS